MGIYERVLESKIKGMNWKKMAYLVSLVSCQCLCAVFWPFQRDLVGFRFADFLDYFNAHTAWDTCAVAGRCF